MATSKSTQGDWRKAHLFGPIVGLTLGVLALLVFTSALLVYRFDATANAREQHMVQHGFQRQIEELDKVVATQVGWDDAIKMLDHRQDGNWADFNIGNYLYTFNGFTHAFVVDGAEQVFYASFNGERAGLETYAPFAASAASLLPQIRKAELLRPPLRRRPGKNNLLIPPIQANTYARVGGRTYIVTATLVQPDFGVYLPKGPRAPVTIAAIPLDQAFLTTFGQRYLLDDLSLAPPGAALSPTGSLALPDTRGASAGVLKWNPREPSAVLFKQLLLPLLIVLGLLCVLALTMMRRSGAVVADLLASEARSKHLAFHDPLTQLPNRAMLFDRLHKLLGGIGSRGGHVLVACVDLDRFKEINDTLGHHAGDLVIAETAARLRAVCGEANLIARLGGDEFVVLCDKAGCADAEAIGENILKALSRPIQCEYGRLEIGCSVGTAVIDHAGVEPTEALRWADLALYRSKQEGRGRVSMFEPDMDKALQDRRSLEADLRIAMTSDQLRMVYQPQVDLGGNIIAVEALLRWKHPVRGDVPPGVFVPLAEETGLILPLGEFVLRRVFSDTRSWRKTRVAINVSAEQMRSRGFAAQVARLAAEAGIDPSRYEVELTETALLCDEPVTAGNINALKRLGFTFALDDFGTGYSSLSVLQRFSVDKIKIDRSFVNGLSDDGESEALVDAMIRLARALDLRVIAEGVESSTQRERLASCGCTEFQGFLTGRPMELSAVVALSGEDQAPGRALKRA
ncbi:MULTISPECIES: EAL domain-containing protein [unclassified Novosphingobium]|uniref:bifunctional diguanylate cyclase/phosphodiesterase n=1 Tax=unclassified Novosphingobium TaxID=2644732 RepID=UPI000EC55F63|nr:MULTISPECIES: EAL domain-containing protein [unclassified Novosphingobium]HCF24650.1 bifunctional diguanylate cyclase/phosphodiesterase [Novosphingobium sp.]HQV04771.1 EAL domain-containing protein [Novosphingobium sp.]